MTHTLLSNPHEARVAFLHTLAATVGCHAACDTALPDARRPDVFRLNPCRNVLFIGDGKHTESPGCTATLARLAGYVGWLRIHVQERGGVAIFAICFGDRAHRKLWMPAICSLAVDAGLSVQEAETRFFDAGLRVAWLRFGDDRCSISSLRRLRA